MTPKAIETRYKGYRFRSRLEARWAVFFDTLGVEWEYEKEGYDLGEAGYYLPDFWLPKHGLFVEIKGTEPTDWERDKAAALVNATGFGCLIMVGTPSADAPCIEFVEDDFLLPADAAECNARFLAQMAGADDWGLAMPCPVCGFEMIHLNEPSLIDSDDYTAWQGRGGAIRIPMWCENGCHAVIRFGMHKGGVWFSVEDAERSVSGLLYIAGSDSRLRNAAAIARGARFEHGESG